VPDEAWFVAAMQTGNKTEPQIAQKLTLATKPKRLVGAILDSLVMLAAFYPFIALSGVIDQLQKGEAISLQNRLIFTALGLALYAIIHGHLLIKHGQTVGKRLVGTRIVDQQGQIPSFERILFLRYYLFNIVGHIPYLGLAIQFLDVMYIFHRDRRCLHDRVTGTVVLDTGPAPLWPWPTVS
jgi:uncharacterized RDD family membrane protein YckC